MKQWRNGVVRIGLCCLPLSACAPQPELDVAVKMLDTPATADSLAPQLFVANGRASLSWLAVTDDGHALRFSAWEGDGWGAPRNVVAGTDWFANWADMPGVRPLRDGWQAWWLQKSAPDTYAYDVQLAFSPDGVDWRPAGTPHHDGTATEHGFVTSFDLPDGGFGMAWLDGRNTAPGEGHAHGAGGMTLRYGQFNAAGAQTVEAELDGLACDCCQTDSAATGDGIVLVYRDRTEAEIRDIHLSRFADGAWSAPVQVHADGWEIAGCPVNGPAVAADGEFVAVAWFTAPQGVGEVRVALSRDGGRSFESPLRVDDGRPEGRVDVVIHPQLGVLVSWLERADAGGQVRLRQVKRDGSPGNSVTLLQTATSRAAGFPRLGLLPDGSLLAVWTEADETARRVRSARIDLL